MSRNLSNEGRAQYRHGGSIGSCTSKGLGMERSWVCSKDRDKDRVTAAYIKIGEDRGKRGQGAGHRPDL